MMRAADIHASVNWPVILEQLGVDAQYLVNRHGPCPACGGKDRFRFDNKGNRGGFYCNGCGAGDGFELLQRVHHWDFRTARDQVMQAARIAGVGQPAPRRTARPAESKPVIAQRPARVIRLWRETCALRECPDAVEYLTSRALRPHAAGSTLKAHKAVGYFAEGQRIGRYPALVAAVCDIDGDLVTVHVTYLESGRKLKPYEPRKLLSPLSGREGCAVRLAPICGDTLGIAEGIETALAAAELYSLPVWSAINATTLAKFAPPVSVKRLVIFADRDEAGLKAAGRLSERLRGRLCVEIRTAPAPAKDFADLIAAREAAA
jgi:putative DNA primase/helicase